MFHELSLPGRGIGDLKIRLKEKRGEVNMSGNRDSDLEGDGLRKIRKATTRLNTEAKPKAAKGGKPSI